MRTVFLSSSMQTASWSRIMAAVVELGAHRELLDKGGVRPYVGLAAAGEEAG